MVRQGWRNSFFKLRSGIAAEAAFDHEFFGVGKGCEAEFGVDAVGVAGGQEPVAVRKVRMVKGELNDVAGEAAAAMGFIDPDVAEVGKAGAVGNDAEEASLSALVEGAEHKRGIFGSALDSFEGDPGSPVGGGEPGMDAGPIYAGKVGGEFVVCQELFRIRLHVAYGEESMAKGGGGRKC